MKISPGESHENSLTLLLLLWLCASLLDLFCRVSITRGMKAVNSKIPSYILKFSEMFVKSPCKSTLSFASQI